MFGIGGSEIIVILVVALLFLGPDKLPDAAKTISKGIRDLKKQTRALQNQIESDEHIGGAIRDLKSALRGDPEYPARPPVRREPPKLPETEAAAETPVIEPPVNETPVIEPPAAPPASDAEPAAALADAKPAVTLPPSVGESDSDEPETTADELDHLIKPASGTVAKNG
jgi:sec-independent protein translocase protein TatB